MQHSNIHLKNQVAEEGAIADAGKATTTGMDMVGPLLIGAAVFARAIVIPDVALWPGQRIVNDGCATGSSGIDLQRRKRAPDIRQLLPLRCQIPICHRGGLIFKIYGPYDQRIESKTGTFYQEKERQETDQDDAPNS